LSFFAVAGAMMTLHHNIYWLIVNFLFHYFHYFAVFCAAEATTAHLQKTIALIIAFVIFPFLLSPEMANANAAAP